MIGYLLNIADMGFTYYFLNRGGYELNPIVRWLLDLHPAAFPFAKIVIAGLLFYLLDRIVKIEPKARIGLYIITAAYAAVVLYYIVIFAAELVA